MISLLWPNGQTSNESSATRWIDDLALETLVAALALNSRYAGTVRATLAALCSDPAVIAYRQDVLADLSARPQLATRLEALLPELSGAAAAGSSHWADEAAIFQVAGRVAELEAYVAAINGLHAALDSADPPLHSSGWRNLQHDLATTVAGETFQALVAELPKLRTQLEQAGSVTLGINLDAQLRPESAALLSINPERFSGPRTLLGKLLGATREQIAGVTPLRHASDRQAFGPDRRLFLDLSELLEEVTRPVAKALTRFARASGAGLATLERELAFYLGAARLIDALQAEGFNVCRPQIAPPAERLIVAEGLYNLDLVLRLRKAADTVDPDAVTANGVRFDDSGRIFVLTGPNRGGKTTYTRALGQMLALAQAGLPVPAQMARISPVDAIYTLFPAAEETKVGMGRLDEEAAQLAAIFRAATANSLVLLNEPLGSTSPREAVVIARDVLCGLRILGATGLLVTHLHELAYAAEGLNDAVDGTSRIGALTAGAVEDDDGAAQRTYTIRVGLPNDRSYATDIAAAHGLHLPQIAQTLRERGL